MSLTPRHPSGRPIVDRKQTLATSQPRHNPFRVLLCQLFPSASRNTGTGIYYNIHDDHNLYPNGGNRSRNVVNFDDYRTHTSSQRLSARDSGSHPSTLRSSRSRRLGRRYRMARIKLPTRRSLSGLLFWCLPARSSSPRRSVLSDRLHSDPVGRSISEHQSRSESLRRIRQEALDSLNRDTPA